MSKMEEYISREQALSYPFANGKYDKKNANPDFIKGCKSYKEWLESLPAEEVIPRFIDDYERGKQFATEYSAGVVCEDEDGFYIGYEQMGARETFSVGQPVYDGDQHLMGYLGIGLFMHLDYAANIKIPVERWMICLPTRNCKAGKKVYTYWKTIKHEKEGAE